MITKGEVQHIAKLARLGLTEAEIEKYQKELSAILGYIEKLKEADIKGVEPMSHSVALENVFRNDETLNRKPETAKRIIELFPDKKDNYLKVKSILGDD